MGRTLLEQGDGIDNPGFTLPGTGSLAITFDDTGTSGLTLDFLVLSGTPSVSIASTGASPHTGFNRLNQLIETDHSLTTVTISGSEPFILGSSTGDSNTGDGVVTDILVMPQSSTTIHSSLTLIDASAATGDLEISAGATNTNPISNITVTYTGLVSGSNFIENDAKNGIVRDGNANSDTTVLLGGAGAKAILGAGFNDNAAMISEDLTNKVLAWASKVATEAAQLSSRQALEEYLAERRRELVFGAQAERIAARDAAPRRQLEC